MLKAIRKSLFNTTVAMTPLLLTACGGDDTDTQKFEVTVLLPLLFFTVSLAHQTLKTRRLNAIDRFA